MKLLRLAEVGSEHPIGDAIIKEAKKRKLDFSGGKNYKAIPGQGIECQYKNDMIFIGNRLFLKEKKIFLKDKKIQLDDIEDRIQELENKGKTTLIVSFNQRIIGLIAVTDILKEFSRQAIRELKIEN